MKGGCSLDQPRGARDIGAREVAGHWVLGLDGGPGGDSGPVAAEAREAGQPGARSPRPSQRKIRLWQVRALSSMVPAGQTASR